MYEHTYIYVLVCFHMHSVLPAAFPQPLGSQQFIGQNGSNKAQIHIHIYTYIIYIIYIYIYIYILKN